jgi:hypothetical protein
LASLQPFQFAFELCSTANHRQNSTFKNEFTFKTSKIGFGEEEEDIFRFFNFELAKRDEEFLPNLITLVGIYRHDLSKLTKLF